MKVAIVHDWLTGMRGGERCLEAFLDIYPDADIFTMIHIKGTTSKRIDGRVKKVSFLNKIPNIKKYYRYFLPLYPFAIKSFDFSGYDLIISLSHAVAKNINKPKNAVHVSYIFTPMRYAWDQAKNYFGKLTYLLYPLLICLRYWDKYQSKNVDYFVAISNFVKARVRCFYKRKAYVIYPPCQSKWKIAPSDEFKKGEAFLLAGAMVPYKYPDVAVKVFSKLDLPLWVVGTGPMKEELEVIKTPNIKFLGRIDDKEFSHYYQNSRALIFPGKEDFGIIPIECLASGRPVIGLYDGALKETIKGVRYWKDEKITNHNGVYIKKGKDREKNLKEALEYFIANEEKFLSKNCVEQSIKYTEDNFKANWNIFISDVFNKKF
ncbi:MAG: glycosyltransferase [Bdellovibrionota bacterium]